MYLASRMEGGAEANIALVAAIAGGNRYSQSKDTMVKLAREPHSAAGVPVFLQTTFAHIGNISKLRDLLAHQQLMWQFAKLGEPWQIMDAVTVNDFYASKMYGFRNATIECSIADLRVAADRFGTESSPKALFDEGFDVTPLPWRYKPSMLKTLLSGTRPNP